MCRLMMFATCLIATLSGTPLRLAEAANDFARCVADRDERQNIETIDGGVGDDSGTAILRTSGHQSPDAMAPPAQPDGPVAMLLPIVLPTSAGHQSASVPIAALSPGSVPKHVWLQRFLF